MRMPKRSTVDVPTFCTSNHSPSASPTAPGSARSSVIASAGAPTSATTVSVVEADTLPQLAVMVVVPCASALAAPVHPIDATAPSELDQVATPAGLPFASSSVAVKGCVVATNTVGSVGAIAIEATAGCAAYPPDPGVPRSLPGPAGWIFCVAARQLQFMNPTLSAIASITSPLAPPAGRGVVMITRSISVPSGAVIRTESVPLLFKFTTLGYL